jgi:hypothetical protein
MKQLACLLIGCMVVAGKIRAQATAMNSNWERNFVFEVKHLDEFFERFDDEKNTMLRTYVQQKFPGIVIDRVSLVNGLFNKTNAGLNASDQQHFSTQVTDSVHPVFLDFAGKDWYASTLCRFRYRGQPIDVKLVLKIQQVANGGMKWVIVSASSDLIKPGTVPDRSGPVTNPSRFLNPMSHATDFMNLSDVFEETEYIKDYLDSSFYKKPWAMGILRAVQQKQLQFVHVKKISYYFFQIEGWTFSVHNFPRRTSNSGWLINRLVKMSDAEKEAYKGKLFKSSAM